MAQQHTVYGQKVTYDEDGKVAKVEGVSHGPCNCGQDNDHTEIVEHVWP